MSYSKEDNTYYIPDNINGSKDTCNCCESKTKISKEVKTISIYQGYDCGFCRYEDRPFAMGSGYNHYPNGCDCFDDIQKEVNVIKCEICEKGPRCKICGENLNLYCHKSGSCLKRTCPDCELKQIINEEMKKKADKDKKLFDKLKEWEHVNVEDLKPDNFYRYTKKTYDVEKKRFKNPRKCVFFELLDILPTGEDGEMVCKAYKKDLKWIIPLPINQSAEYVFYKRTNNI